MARTPFICGNWKMHKTVEETIALLEELLPKIAPLAGVEVGVAPPFTSLHAAKKRMTGSKVRLAGQNVHQEREGAYTGEISAPMLKAVGCEYAIIGHSERRILFGETDEVIGAKVSSALGHGLQVILCLGETLQERDANQTLAVVTRQFKEGVGNVDAEGAGRLVLAYEPVWAIGTGRTATPSQAQEVHAHLRHQVGDRFGPATADALRIQYGGSMKPNNARDLLAQPDIDGGLIGGASLKADAFAEICAAAQRP